MFDTLDNKDLRKSAKMLNFATMYGGGPSDEMMEGMAYEIGKQHAKDGKVNDDMHINTLILKHENAYINGLMVGLGEE